MRHIIALLALLSLCGCGGTPLAATPLAATTPSTTPMVYRHCAWAGSAEVWIDTNANGLWEPDERPLAGVEVAARTLRSGAGGRGKTGADGRAGLSSGLLDCPIPEMRSYVSMPPGYRTTTPDWSDTTKARFGLVPVTSTVATATRATAPAIGTATTARIPSAAATPTRAWGPPSATLAHGAEIRPGQRFSYSWQEAGRGVSGCGAPILSTMRTLSAPAGATLLLTIAEDIPLNGIVIRPTPLNAQGKRETTPFSAELPLRFADSHAEIVAVLPPGDYLLAVYTRLPNGSADYGFRITTTP